MKKLALFFFLFSCGLFAQTQQQCDAGKCFGLGAPVGACSAGTKYAQVDGQGNQPVLWMCGGIPPTWQQGASGGGNVNGISLAQGQAALATSATGITVDTTLHADAYPSSCTVAGVSYTDQIACAFYSAVASVNGAGSILMLGGHRYTTKVSLVEPATGPQVSIVGAGPGDNIYPTTIQATAAMQAIIIHADIPTASSLPSNLRIENLNIDANNLANDCVNIYAERVGTMTNVNCRNGADTSATGAWMDFGDDNPASGNQGGGYQFHVSKVFVEGVTSTPSQWATVTASQASGVPSFTVTSGGTYHYSNPPAFLYGFGSGTSATPCTTMGTLSVTMSGTQVSAVTGTGFSGCSGTMYVYVPDMPPAGYGFHFGFTDSYLDNVHVQGVGQAACINYAHGANVIVKDHGWACPTDVLDSAANVHVAPEFDSPIHLGMDIENNAVQVIGATFTWNSTYPGSSGYYFGSGVTRANISGSTCGSAASTGYHQFISATSGPYPEGSTVAYPAGYTLTADVQCDNNAQVDWHGILQTTALWVPVDNATQAPNQAGTGANTSMCGWGVASNRGQICWNSVDGALVLNVASGNGIELMFGTNATSSRMWRLTGTALLVGSSTQQTVIDNQRNFFGATYNGPASAPTGTCSTIGQWVLSQDGHATYCDGSNWQSKI